MKEHVVLQFITIIQNQHMEIHDFYCNMKGMEICNVKI